PLILIALTDLKQQFKTFSIFFKSSLILVFILALAQCASPPFLIDNESYYIQTIKWLNEYGFVKGLTNLHVFLGQTSGWHILQSAFNFSFIYDSLNDISGFCLLLGNFYAMSKLNLYIKSKKKNALDLIIGLFPLFNVFFFQFISVPSADIAIYVITLIVFHQFTTCFLVYKKSTFITLALLTIFASFIKLTGVFLFLFTIIIYLKYYIEAKKLTLLISGFGAITLSLFIIKNLILTGTILYPLHGIIETSWSLPETITEYISNYSKASTYNLTIDNYNTASKINLFKHWLLLPKLDGIINKLMLLILLIFPLVI
ncbi:LIC_10190 family membrane protein, partial [Pontimicrobium sp. MEBiC01747]